MIFHIFTTHHLEDSGLWWHVLIHEAVLELNGWKHTGVIQVSGRCGRPICSETATITLFLAKWSTGASPAIHRVLSNTWAEYHFWVNNPFNFLDVFSLLSFGLTCLWFSSHQNTSVLCLPHTHTRRVIVINCGEAVTRKDAQCIYP